MVNIGRTVPFLDRNISAKAVANYFLDLGKRDGIAITPLKIQKLVYISHGWHLALTDGKPLVCDEYAEAWPYGPVFPSLYHEFKRFGDTPIKSYAEEIVLHRGLSHDYELEEEYEVVIPKVYDKEVKKLLDKIWEFYSDTSGPTLSRITHRKGSPWHKIWEQHKGMKNVHIPNEKIEEYYKSLMK